LVRKEEIPAHPLRRARLRGRGGEVSTGWPTSSARWEHPASDRSRNEDCQSQEQSQR
jgi:hypothetical protein